MCTRKVTQLDCAKNFVVFLDLSETAADQLNEVTKAALAIYRGVSSVPFPFRFPFQLHCELISSLLALDATELVSQPLTQMVVEMINIHVISVQQKR